MKNNSNDGNVLPFCPNANPLPLNVSITDMLELIPCAVFSFHFTGRESVVIPYASSHLLDIVGLEPADVAEDAAPFLNTIVKDDVDAFLAAADESASSMSLWEVEFRIAHPLKGEVWIEWQAAPVLQDDGVTWNGVMLDITERKAMQSRMELLECAVNRSADAVYLVNDELQFEYVNDVVCRTLGYTRDELLHMGPMDIDPDTDLDSVSDIYLQSIVDDQFSFESRHRARSGRVFPVEITVSRVKYGMRYFNLCIARDISEHHRMLHELRKSERDFHSLADHLPDNVVRWDTEGRYLYLNAAMERTLGVAAAEVHGKSAADIFPDQFLEAHTNIGCIASTGKPHYIHRLEVPGDNGEKRFHDVKLIPEYGADGRVVSVLGLGRDMTDYYREKEDIAARESELLRLQYAVNASADSMFIVDENYRFVTVNDAACRKLGYSSEELLAMSPFDIDPYITQDKIAQIAETVKDGTTEPFETCHRTKDGRILPVEVVSTEFNDGGGRYVISVARDMSERKRAEQKIALLERSINVSVDALYVIDIESIAHTILDVNDTACRMLGYSRDELIGMSPLDIDPDITQEQLAHFSKTQQAGHVNVFETRHRAKDGRLVPVEIASNIYARDGHRYSIAMVRDITERKHAQRRQYLLECAVESMFDGSLLIDRQGTILDGNRAICELLGYTKSEITGKPLFQIATEFSAEDWDTHWEEIIEMGGSMQIETIDRSKGGVDIPVEVSISLFEFEGEEYNLACVRDISERMKTEERLRMAVNVFEAAREGITITDKEGIILDVNPAFTRITGYSGREVVGNNPNVLASGKHGGDFYKAMWASLLDHGEWSGEVINRRKNGELYTEHLNIVAVHDDVGAVKHYVGVFSDISLLKKQESHLQHIAHHDVLTDLPNRMLLTSRLTHAIAGTRNTDQMLGILYLDLDGFKPVNDNYGHDVGDRVLVEVSHRISGYLRAIDTVARIGGDEFVVLLAGVADSEECRCTASRLLDVIATPIHVDEQVVNLTVSIGICLYQSDSQDEADTLLRYADQAMYLAKSAGRNQYVFYDSHAQNDICEDNRTIHDLRQALKEKQFSVYYQPIIDLAAGRVVKAEALVRWRHPKLGMIPPSEFIPVAENGGLIYEIGDLVFENAARVAKELNCHKAKPDSDPVQISVNRSPRQFFHRDGVDKWVQYLEEHAVSGELLGVEITEGLLLDDWPDVLRQLNKLRDIGVSISLDDFGTGYSALSYLKKFSIDYLKIDRSFVCDLVEDSDYQAIVNSIIAMARQLGIQTIGEGVETSEQAELLKEAGCNMVQGYFYAKPMPESDFLDFVTKDWI